ncbi:MAG: protein-L-isoaspartate(D-aspartate) O-methyltransferase [Acidobacteria bacterium]|nr:protein-L-isoaspartate(D-aspartate) O-methyltransferase [Acidobacteriota bacterium]
MTSVGERFQRDKMLRDLEKRGIRDRRVLDAMGKVPRHRFVRQQFQLQAYSSYALPSRADQTISQPYIVARTTEILELEPHHSVLEIGTGTGYHTAVLALLAQRVYSLERVHDLARNAIQRIRELGYDNVKIQTFDGTVGWSEVAPFDRILVTAGAPRAPRPLLEQLKVGGRLLIPEGSKDAQRLVLYERREDSYLRHEGEPVAFVPLLGRHGW